MSQSPFLNFVRKEYELPGYSVRIEKTFMYWIKQYLLSKNVTQKRWVQKRLKGSV